MRELLEVLVVLLVGVVGGLVVGHRLARNRVAVAKANGVVAVRGSVAHYLAIVDAWRPSFVPMVGFLEAHLAKPGSSLWQTLEAEVPAHRTVREVLEQLLEVERARERGTGCACRRELCPLHRGRVA